MEKYFSIIAHLKQKFSKRTTQNLGYKKQYNYEWITKLYIQNKMIYQSILCGNHNANGTML